MKKFWIDYSTSVGIYAESTEDAKTRFFQDNYEDFGCGEIVIDCIEEEEEEED